VILKISGDQKMNLNLSDSKLYEDLLNAKCFKSSIISTNLLRSWQRSEHKPEGWNQECAINAIRKYEKFLALIAKYPGIPHAPTRDIDEIWHLHMLSPKAYLNDCNKLFGEILDHDGGFGKEPEEEVVLKATFNHTAMLWEKEYGEPYTSGKDTSSTNCWHDCVGRCWHACKSNIQIAS